MAKTNEINDILSQGNAISKIMMGGGIVWQKLYKWKVYKVDYIYEYRYRLNRYSDNRLNGGFVSTLYEDIKFDELTGEVTGVSRVNYYEYDQYYNKTLYYVGDTSMYEGYYGSGGYFSTHRLSVSKYIYTTTKSKGNYLKEISAANKNEYPSNGIKGDYWYEFVG